MVSRYPLAAMAQTKVRSPAPRATAVRRFVLKCRRIANMLRAVPFAQPRVSQMLFATFSGIFLSIGMDLVLKVLDGFPRTWTHVQSAGTLFVVASIAFSILAWQAQGLLDYLGQKGKTAAGTEEKSNYFGEWPERGLSRLMLGIGVGATLSAVAVLILTNKPA